MWWWASLPSLKGPTDRDIRSSERRRRWWTHWTRATGSRSGCQRAIGTGDIFSATLDKNVPKKFFINDISKIRLWIEEQGEQTSFSLDRFSFDLIAEIDTRWSWYLYNSRFLLLLHIMSIVIVFSCQHAYIRRSFFEHFLPESIVF